MADQATRLAVLGSPIAHSKSPALHTAAYRVLGLPWSYERIEVTAAQLDGFLTEAGPEWRGVSLTMPLKERALQLAESVDPTAALTGAVNTLLLPVGTAERADPGPWTSDPQASDHDPADSAPRLVGFNTDVAGITRALAEAGILHLNHAWLLGAGATAHSALVAVSELGGRQVTVIARSPDRAARLAALGTRLGVVVEVRTEPRPALNAGSEYGGSPDLPDLVVSTVPGAARLPWTFSTSVRERAVLLDVAYDPWPSVLAMSWADAHGTVLSGFDMLVQQALVQVRIFVSGRPEQALPDEARILDAMRATVRS